VTPLNGARARIPARLHGCTERLITPPASPATSETSTISGRMTGTKKCRSHASARGADQFTIPFQANLLGPDSVALSDHLRAPARFMAKAVPAEASNVRQEGSGTPVGESVGVSVG